MRRILVTTVIAAATFAAPLAAQAGAAGCPPGLAKKQNGCLPPGQAKKIYNNNQPRYLRNGILVEYPQRYGLNPAYTYYRSGGNVYRVDRDTREVLDLIGAVSRILN
ncbi:excinuclease ABC subunit A [Roseovarius indicus]|uniref:excinuclease ABC subunit A n=1 Tax=Roseovarius indicus TaxID=540747 RepID=UPI0032F07180